MFHKNKSYPNQLLQQAKKSAFIKNVGILLTGSFFAQLIVFLLSPIYSRLYTPDDFGKFSTIIAFVSIIATGANLRYCNAMMLPKERNKAHQLFLIAVLSSGMVAFLTFLILAIMTKDIIYRIFTMNISWGYFAYICIAIFVIAVGETTSFWLARNKQYVFMSSLKVFSSIGNAVIKLSCGFFGLALNGLLASQFVGVLITPLLFFRKTAKRIPPLLKGISWRELSRTAKEYANYPFFMLPQTVLSTFSNQMPFMLIAAFYSAGDAGQYFIAYSLIKLPVEMFVQSTQKVSLQKMSEISILRGGELRMFLLKSTALLALIGSLPLLVLILFGPYLFSTVLGNDWEPAGQFSKILAPWFFMVLITPPSRVYYEIKMKQRLLAFFEIFSAVRILFFIPIVFHLEIRDALILNSTWGVCVEFSLFLTALVLSKRNPLSKWPNAVNS